MSLLQSLQNAFPGLQTKQEGSDFSLEASSQAVHDVLKLLKRDMGFILLLDIIATDYKDYKSENKPKRFMVVYHLLHMEEHRRLRIKVELEESESLTSICDLWCGAAWPEREVAEMFGLQFDQHKTQKLLTPLTLKGFPLRKDWQATEMVEAPPFEPPQFSWQPDIPDDERLCRQIIDITPSHPAIQGTFLVRAEILGHKVKRTLVEIGMQHRGVEKIAESKLLNQFIPYAERLNFSSPMMGAIAWAKTVESALNVEITDRCQALRMIMMELSRVLDHATCLAAMAQDLRAWDASASFYRIREHICALFVSYTGARLMGPSIRIGGMINDLPVGWVTRCLDSIKLIQIEIAEIRKLLTQAPSWLIFHGEGEMNAADAIEWGFSGPCLRACGVNYDLRKNSPYYFYQDVEFEVPLGINGDPYDRYLVRVEEMYQSLKIVSQVLDHIPSGAIQTDDPRLAKPVGSMRLTSADYAKHFELFQNGTKLAAGEYYSFLESANGELGFYLISDGEGSPYRLKIRGPSFYHFQSFPNSAQDISLDSAAAMLASLNAVSGEIDR